MATRKKKGRAKGGRAKGPQRGKAARVSTPTRPRGRTGRRTVGSTARPSPGGARKKTSRRPPPPKPSRRKLAPKVRAQLYEAVKTVRKHIRGYESGDGYSLRDLNTFDKAKRDRIIRRAAKLRELTNVPHDLVKPTTKKGRKSLDLFTKQNIRGAKHYIVHKPADNFKVRLRNGNVDIEGKFGNRVITRSQFFLFPRKPRYPKELVAMTNRLKKEMPQGFYTVITAAHGDTGEPFERDDIINRLNEYLAAYEVDASGQTTGFSEALVGFRFMATSLDGAVTQRRQIDKRRERQKEFNQKQRKKLIKELTPRKKRAKRKLRKGK